MAETALELASVVKRFAGRPALDGLSLTLAPGEVFALLGPNGAGKTTTINLILGFLRPDEGRVVVGGVDALADPLGARAKAAYIPEQVALYPDMSGLENLRYFTTLAGLSLDRATCDALLDEAGLQPEARTRKAGRYSRLWTHNRVHGFGYAAILRAPNKTGVGAFAGA